MWKLLPAFVWLAAVVAPSFADQRATELEAENTRLRARVAELEARIATLTADTGGTKAVATPATQPAGGALTPGQVFQLIPAEHFRKSAREMTQLDHTKRGAWIEKNVPRQTVRLTMTVRGVKQHMDPMLAFASPETRDANLKEYSVDGDIPAETVGQRRLVVVANTMFPESELAKLSELKTGASIDVVGEVSKVSIGPAPAVWPPPRDNDERWEMKLELKNCVVKKQG